MAKQELEKEQEEKKKNGTKERPNKKEVIITVYVESPSPSSASHSHQKTDQFKKIKPNQNSRKPRQMAKTGGYDRRAHLLAYAQELRTTGGSQQVQWPKSGSKPKLRIGIRYQTITPDGKNAHECINYQTEMYVHIAGGWQKVHNSSETQKNKKQMEISALSPTSRHIVQSQIHHLQEQKGHWIRTQC
ncbi:hypothetical protein GBA52_000829 [Prunus armeniaca]|nr:hypothetical protein GBA52_000829 [Prunus armeniaca]